MITEAQTNKEITLFFNGRDLEDRLVYAELKRISDFGYKLNGVDVSERKLDVEQAERITRELGGTTPERVLSEDFLKSYLVSHVNNFNEFNTVGQLLEDSTTLKTPILIKDGIMEFLDTSHDVVYEELKEEHELFHQQREREKTPVKTRSLMNNYINSQVALYLTILILVASLVYQIVSYERAIHTDTFPAPETVVETSTAFFEI